MSNLHLEDIEQNIQPELFDHLTRISNTYTASKINTNEQIDFLKSRNIQLAIDFKNQDETEFNEELEFEKSGIKYQRFAISSIDELNLEKLNEFKKIYENGPNNKLLFCMSSNRVGALLALYLFKLEKRSAAEAFQIGVAAGLTRAELQNKIKKELNVL